MAEIDKKQIALFAGMGLFVVAMILLTISNFKDAEKTAAKEEESLTMEAPDAKPQTQKSTLDVYEQEVTASDQKESEEFTFTGPADEEPKEQVSKQPETAPNLPEPDAKPKNGKAKKKAISSGRRSAKVNKETPGQNEEVEEEGLIRASEVDQPKKSASENKDNSFAAVFHGSQTLVHGSPVRLRLTKDFNFKNHTLPAGSIITGEASFASDFVYINVTTLVIDGTPYDCKYTGYKGHVRGFYSKDSENKEIVRENVNNNSGKTITIKAPVIGSVGVGGLNRKTTSKEREVTIPSQTSMQFSSKDNL